VVDRDGRGGKRIRRVARRRTGKVAIEGRIPIREGKLPVRGIPSCLQEQVQRIGRDLGKRTPLETSRDGFEAGIGYKVELRGDMIRSHVADKPNGRRMGRRKPEKLSAASAGLPFWDFLAILEARIQDINGTSENASTVKIVAAGSSTAENFNRSKPIGLGDMIV
jgi:hypothetical protein